MKNKCKVLHLRWEQPHKIVQFREHPLAKQLSRKGLPKPHEQQEEQASVVTAMAIAVLAVKGKDFLVLVKPQLEYFIQSGEPHYKKEKDILSKSSELID